MQVTMQVKDLLNILEEVSYREEIQEKLGLKNRDYFRKNYLKSCHRSPGCCQGDEGSRRAPPRYPSPGAQEAQ